MNRSAEKRSAKNRSAVKRPVARLSFELVQIRVRCGMAEETAHRDDLAFVVEGVREDVMQHERRSAVKDAVREAELGVGVELLIGETGKIVERVCERASACRVWASEIAGQRAGFQSPAGRPRSRETQRTSHPRR
jgi:hypothetical protein